MVIPHKPNSQEALSAWLDDAPPTPTDNPLWPETVINVPVSPQQISTYLAIGQALRGGTDAEVLSNERVDAFWQRVRSGLNTAPDVDEAAPLFDKELTAANDGQFKWPAIASVALVALALSSWLAIGPEPSDMASPALATYTPEFVPVMSANASVVRDPELDAFLAAHRQRGSASALQGPVGFVRNVAWQAGAP